MTQDDLIQDRDLEPAYASASLADCELTFHRQRATQDVWAIARGPLGTLALPIADRTGLDRLRATGRRSSGAPGPRPGGVRIPLDDDFAVDLRARGPELRGTYVFADGSPFGGMGSGLPSLRKAPLRDRLLDWLRGRRGRGYEVAVHKD